MPTPPTMMNDSPLSSKRKKKESALLPKKKKSKCLVAEEKNSKCLVAEENKSMCLFAEGKKSKVGIPCPTPPHND